MFTLNFTGDDPEMVSQIKKICIILKELGQEVSKTCGGHIHIGANYLTNTKAWQNLVELWANTERILFIISNAKGEIPRPGIKEHAEPVSRDLEEQIAIGMIKLNKESDLQDYKNQIRRAQIKREKGISFHNLMEGGIQTIEFRIPNGTLSPETWLENISLFGGIVRAAEDLSIIQQKAKGEATEQECYLLECFELIRNKAVNEEQTLEILLELVIPESERDIYRERYRINNSLLQQNPEINNHIGCNVADGSIKINEDSLFSGSDRITRGELSQTSIELKENLRLKLR